MECPRIFRYSLSVARARTTLRTGEHSLVFLTHADCIHVAIYHRTRTLVETEGHFGDLLVIYPKRLSFTEPLSAPLRGRNSLHKLPSQAEIVSLPSLHVVR